MPFVLAAVVLGAASPILLPFALLCLVHAWGIPELYAAIAARELHARSGLILEPGRLGVWLVGEAGALLVRPGGRRVHCYCVKATDPKLPPSDRLAHLLLALRTDELGFATVANLAFSGACWRVRRRLAAPARPALEAAVRSARER